MKQDRRVSVSGFKKWLEKETDRLQKCEGYSTDEQISRLAIANYVLYMYVGYCKSKTGKANE